MEKISAGKTAAKLMQKAIAQLLLFALIFIFSTKKALSASQQGIFINQPPSAGLAPRPTEAGIIMNISNWLLYILFSIGIIFYIIYFYRAVIKKNAEKSKIYLRISIAAISAVVLLYILISSYFQGILNYLNIF